MDFIKMIDKTPGLLELSVLLMGGTVGHDP